MTAGEMSDRHEKAERAQGESHLLFAQKEFALQTDGHEVEEHALTHSPEEESEGDKKQITIQVSSLKKT